jgi:uncharacterized protein (UPF0333 family)
MTISSMTIRSKQGQPVLLLALVCVFCVLLTVETGCAPAKVEAPAAVAVTFPTPYQAVLLSNNSVYFGKLAGYGTSNPVLTEVYYIISKSDPTTKQVQNILVKRGKELHGPDRMYLNPNQIVFVEPVGADSKVAQLISEASKQQ